MRRSDAKSAAAEPTPPLSRGGAFSRATDAAEAERWRRQAKMATSTATSTNRAPHTAQPITMAGDTADARAEARPNRASADAVTARLGPNHRPSMPRALPRMVPSASASDSASCGCSCGCPCVVATGSDSCVPSHADRSTHSNGCHCALALARHVTCCLTPQPPRDVICCEVRSIDDAPRVSRSSSAASAAGERPQSAPTSASAPSRHTEPEPNKCSSAPAQPSKSVCESPASEQPCKLRTTRYCAPSARGSVRRPRSEKTMLWLSVAPTDTLVADVSPAHRA